MRDDPARASNSQAEECGECDFPARSRQCFLATATGVTATGEEPSTGTGYGLQPSLLLIAAARVCVSWFFLLALPGPVLLRSFALSVLTIPLQPIPSVTFSLVELPKVVSVFLAGL